MSAWEHLVEIVVEIEGSGYKFMRAERVVHAFAATHRQPTNFSMRHPSHR